MKICIAAVGQRMPSWAEEAIGEFLARLPRDFQIELRAVRAETRKGQPVARTRATEASRLAAVLPADSFVIALDEKGRDWTSAQFAASLSAWRDAGRPPAFVLGGADGLDPQFMERAALRLRLSSMTLPHALARVVLVEQLYRAWSILSAHPYHRS